MMYSLDEIGIVPSSVPVDIEHRRDINIYLDGKKQLPIFVSPMSSVLNKDNIKVFKDAGFIPIVPRSEPIKVRIGFDKSNWSAYSLQEFEEEFCNSSSSNEERFALIDVANGHMLKIYNLVKQAKFINPNLKIMVGNIAHPNMYYTCYKAGVDFVRISVGTGTACLSSVMLGVHTSMSWILQGIKRIKQELLNSPNFKPFPKIIADGGLNTIDRIIKCYALGADYVMCGKIFAQCEEACGKIRTVNNTEFKERKYYGMASEQGQKDISGGICKATEGIETWVPVNSNLKTLHYLISSYLRSAMSYTGSKDIEHFKNNTQVEVMSISERNAYYK